MEIPQIVAAARGDYLGARMAAALGFAVPRSGQAAGPSVVSAIADATGSFGLAFLAAGVAFSGQSGLAVAAAAAVSNQPGGVVGCALSR